MQVDVKTFEIGNLNQSVIRPRKYDALLFGQIINHESDLFAFWHSSQRKDPGLNVAMYTNAKVDKILEDAFTTTDAGERTGKYAQFEDEVEKDHAGGLPLQPELHIRRIERPRQRRHRPHDIPRRPVPERICMVH